MKFKFNPKEDSVSGAGELDVQIVVITPALATQMLGGNTDNRRIRPGTVEKYARDMAAGDWRLNGDAIRFNGDGTLLDGQHRLLACIKANTNFKSLVISGLSHEDRQTFDVGAKRSMTDILRWRGETSQALLASIIGWCVKYEADRFRDPQFQPTHAELLAWLDENPGVRESMNIGRQVSAQVLIPPTVLAAIHYETSRFDSEDADAFMAKLKSGADLEEGSPILALRKWASGVGAKRDKPSAVVYAAVTIKAMNAWRDGRTMTSIGWRAGGAHAEKFPRLNDSVAVAA